MAMAMAMAMAMVRIQKPRHDRSLGTVMKRKSKTAGQPDLAQSGSVPPLLKWGKRVIILLGAGVLASYSAINAYSTTTHDTSPDFALLVNPSDPVAMVRMADFQWAVDQSDKTRLSVQARVKAGLTGQAINVRALRLLAMVTKQKAQSAGAEKLIQLASRTSRRELGTQIWLIDRAAAKGDAQQTLRQYDVVLRSNPQAPKLLFPGLAKALANGEIRQNFVPFVKNDRSWLHDFLSYAVYNDINPVALAQLFLAADGFPRDKRYRVVESTLVERLFKTAHYPEAALVGQRISPQSRLAGQQIALNSANTSEKAAPFQWRTGEVISANSGLIANANNSGSTIQAWAQPGGRGLAASKLLALPSGRFGFNGKVTVNSGTLAVGSYWQISCLNGIQQSMIWRNNLVETTGASNSFQIGGNCPYQLLELYLESAPASDGARVELSELALRPA
jgi:hypothetical protein